MINFLRHAYVYVTEAKLEKYAPMMITVMNIVCSFGYVFGKDYAKAAYWLGAAIVTGSTLFM